jgi:hypothetical protein
MNAPFAMALTVYFFVADSHCLGRVCLAGIALRLGVPIIAWFEERTLLPRAQTTALASSTEAIVVPITINAAMTRIIVDFILTLLDTRTTALLFA